MRRLLLLGLLLGVAGVAGVVGPAIADHPGGATMSDIRQLQDDVELLDESMSQLDSRGTRAADFRRREDAIRDRLVRLRSQVERHRANPDQGLGATYDDVQDLRRSIVDLRNDIDNSLGSRERRSESTGRVNVPDGTEMRISLDQSVSSRTARREDRIEATLSESVRVGNRLAIPAGNRVTGIVTDAVPAERPSHGGRLELSFDTLLLPGGERIRIPTRVVNV